MTNGIERVRQLTSKNEGCISDAEGELLYKLARDVPDGQVIVDECTHYWIINPEEIGICKLCGRKRNFERLRRVALETENKRRQVGRKGK